MLNPFVFHFGILCFFFLLVVVPFARFRSIYGNETHTHTFIIQFLFFFSCILSHHWVRYLHSNGIDAWSIYNFRVSFLLLLSLWHQLEIIEKLELTPWEMAIEDECSLKTTKFNLAREINAINKLIRWLVYVVFFFFFSFFFFLTKIFKQIWSIFHCVTLLFQY